MTDWQQMVTDMNGLTRDLRNLQPDVMRAFADMAKAASGPAALDSKVKELIALGISVAVRCDPCIAYHTRAAVRAGASEAEIAETLGMAVYMGAGPSVMYAAKALEAARSWSGEG
ncbi:MAG: carboxymuconolactone decarboxylase family protein [Sphingomonadaceae bacterium]